MDYQVVKVFLASSNELVSDRAFFGDFIRWVNDIYEHHGVQIKLLKWEEHNADYNLERKQNEYDVKVRESDFFVALFQHFARKYTIEELDVAIDTYQVQRTPQICVYMKDLLPGEYLSPELNVLRKRLVDELAYVWLRYGDVNTLKLNFVLKLQLLELNPQVQIKLIDSQVFLDGYKLVSLAQIPFIANNIEYIHLKQELVGLERELGELDHEINGSDVAKTLENILIGKQQRYDQLKEQLDKQEKALFNVAVDIVKLQGPHCSARFRHAVELFESGDHRGADILLSTGEIDKDAKQARASFDAIKEFTDLLLEEKREPIRVCIGEYRLKIRLIMANLKDESQLSRACEVYQTALTLTENRLSPKEYVDLLFDYANFLRVYHQYDQAVFFYEKLLQFTKPFINREPDLYLAKVLFAYNSQAGAYQAMQEYVKAEEVYLKIVDICQNFSDERIMKYPDCLPVVYSNLGLLYVITHTSGAEKMFLNAIDLWEELVKESPEVFGSHLVHVQGQLILYYMESGYVKKVEDLLKEILDNYERFNLKQTEIESWLMLNANLSCFYLKHKRFQEAEKILKEVLNLGEDLYQHDPLKYLPLLAKIQSMMGNWYMDINRFDDAENMYRKALSAQKYLAVRNPEVFLSGLTDLYNNLGIYYRRRKWNDKAEDIYLKALKNFELLADKNPEVYLTALALIYGNLGNLYSDLEDSKKTEFYWRQRLEIYKKIEVRNREVYMPDTAEAYYVLGKFYFERKQLPEAVENIGEALRRWHTLANIHPEVYFREKGKALVMMSQVYGEMEDLPNTNKYLIATAKIFNRLAKENPVMYLPILGETLRNLGLWSETKFLDFFWARKYYFQASKAFELLFSLDRKAGQDLLKQIYSDLEYICRETGEAGMADLYKEYADKGEILPGTIKIDF